MSPLYLCGLGCPPRNVSPFLPCIPCSIFTPHQIGCLHVGRVVRLVSYIVLSVRFSCPLPRISSGSPLLASVPRSGLSWLPWCHFCLFPVEVCVAALPASVISLYRHVFHPLSPAPFLRALCGLSSAPLLSPLVCPSVCLLLLVPQYPPMK